MLHENGLVDNDRLPLQKDRAMLHQHRLWLIDHVLGFRREFPASDNSSSDGEAACDLAGEFHDSKKRGWLTWGISPLDALTLACLNRLLSDVAHQQL